MAKYEVSWNDKQYQKTKKNEEVMIPAWKISKEIGLTFPIFISVFFPRSKFFYEKFLKNLVEETPTWSHGLFLHNIHHIQYNYAGKWQSLFVTWQDYKTIKQRWDLFDKIKKKVILKQNTTLLEIYPLLEQFFSIDERTKLSPYIGLNMEFFGEIHKLDTYRHYQTNEIKPQMTIIDIRSMLEKNERNIFTTHFVFNITESQVKDLIKEISIGDTVKFKAVVVRYENPSFNNIDRIGLSQFKIIQIFPKEEE